MASITYMASYHNLLNIKYLVTIKFNFTNLILIRKLLLKKKNFKKSQSAHDVTILLQPPSPPL